MFGKVATRSGLDTHKNRIALGLRKTKSKLSDTFDAHNVDSWILANMATGGHTVPDNKNILRMVPLNTHRRQLHKFGYAKGGLKVRYGGTISQGFKKGALIKHRKYGLSYVGGNADRGISLHSLSDGELLTRKAKAVDIKFLAYSSFRTFNVKAA